MSFYFAFQKILEVKENDKLKAEKEFSQATRKFEEVATKLYDLLKKKETFEDNYYERIATGMSVHEIQQTNGVIAAIDRQIEQAQYYTQKAREEMHYKEKLLTEKSIELKKYEKMKEIKYNEYVEEEKQLEMKLMDEISVTQFINR